jgi:hypothetical protein
MIIRHVLRFLGIQFIGSEDFLNIILTARRSRLLATTFLALGSLTTAYPSLVYDSTLVVSGAGFGNLPRHLTIQGPGNATSTSGCIGLSGGSLTFGDCIADASVTDNNGVTNAGGDEPPPLADNQKYGAPTLAELGITSADQIQIIFDATQGGGSSITITDLTLKFYGANGSLVGAIDGQQTFASTVPGNGSAGFAFVVSQDELAQVNTFLTTTSRLTLEASFTGAGGGPESFFIRNGDAGGGPSEVPEPGTWMSLTGGFFAVGGLKVFRRFRRNV